MREDVGRYDIEEEIPYSGSSRMELKRSHQWLTEPSGSELFSNKRQLAEIDAHFNLPAWDSSLVPRQLNDCLFDPANAHSSDLLARYVSQINGQHIEEEQCGNVSSIGLPVFHTLHDSSFDLDTIRKVKLNEVSGPTNMPASMVQLYGEGISTPSETGPSGQDNPLSFGQHSSDVNESFLFPGPFYSKTDVNFIPNFTNEGVVGVIPMGDIFDEGDGNVFSTCHPFEKGVGNFALMGQSLQKADCNVFSVSPSYNKGQDYLMSLLDKVPENLFMAESNYDKENANVLSGGRSTYTEGGEMAYMVSSQGRADENNDRISHEDRSKIISFGDYQKETTIGSSVSVTNSNENFSHAPANAKDHLHMEAEENMSLEFRNPLYGSPRVDTSLIPKSKDSKAAKKGSTNTFPSNVKALLSTGMFDGVTVKYYSWSREKNLKGIIKGTGYLCGCANCNLNKVLNAYEFERHANCKTKHPNNHIYFENGKTIYGVVQELKNTPQEKLFDAIQNVTGSDINHKNFNTWKASYQVASIELKRIYGIDAVTLAS
uniref:Tify domain-containing protein n=1 Tax=Noccaea caerulescens TaxID=107243 RepID=A0A1J3JX75_NOCCA